MRISKYKFASFEHSIDQIGKTHHLAQLNRLKEYDFGFKMWDKPPGGGGGGGLVKNLNFLWLTAPFWGY